MFLDLQVGNLVEPITGRKWDRATIKRQFIQRAAFYHREGLSPGDRVFVHYGNNLEFFADLLAIWSLGGCIIPIDSRLTKYEVETLARTAAPRFSLCDRNVDDDIAAALLQLKVKVLFTDKAISERATTEMPAISGNRFTLDQPALILFTSGTTGQPKGVVHTHRSLRARWMTLQQSLGLIKYRRTLCLLPTHFGHGLICNCLFPWLYGQDLFILPPFKPEIILQLGAILDAHEITFMSSVPSVWKLALKMAKPPQTQKLERVFCGSAPLSAYLWKEIQKWTGTNEVFNSYGITETGSWVAGTTLPDFTPEDGLIGEPWGAVIKILKTSSTETPPCLMQQCETGESGYVWINTPALMQGYFGRDDLTDAVVNQGWFMTGDIGIFDDKGRLYLRGREREEINKGGMKVYPGDIDAVIERFANVLDVCCFGYKDNGLYNENIGVAIVLKEQNNGILRDLYEWTDMHLAKYQMPLRWHIVEEIPRTPRGKINRTKVAEECSRLNHLTLKDLAGSK